MPLYRLKCPNCPKTSEIFRKMSDRDSLPLCECGSETYRALGAPAVIGTSFSPYRSPASGKVIESRQAQSEDLKRTGMILSEPGLDRDVKRWGEERKEKSFQPIAAGVDAVVSQLVNSQIIES